MNDVPSDSDDEQSNEPGDATRSPNPRHRPLDRGPVQPRRSWFWPAMMSLGGCYLLLIVGMVVADLQYASWADIVNSLQDRQVRFSIALSLFTCTISAILATWVAVPTGYVLARTAAPIVSPSDVKRRTWSAWRVAFLRRLIETLFDIPVVLPPIAVGISLLILFQTPLGKSLDSAFGRVMRGVGFPGIRGITYEIPAIILAQFTVATAFAIRIMHATFQHIDKTPEQMALVSGANRLETFWWIAIPQSKHGIIHAFTIAWARSLGEFGPILIFAGTARMRTEVLATTVYLNFSFGNLRGALTASLLMLFLASTVLIVARWLADHTFDG